MILPTNTVFLHYYFFDKFEICVTTEPIEVEYYDRFVSYPKTVEFLGETVKVSRTHFKSPPFPYDSTHFVALKLPTPSAGIQHIFVPVYVTDDEQTLLYTEKDHHRLCEVRP